MGFSGEGCDGVALDRDERWSRARAQALLEEEGSGIITGMARESTMGPGVKIFACTLAHSARRSG